MSEEVIKVLEYISEKLGVAIDWTTENALPYVEEVVGKFITYNIVYNTIGLLIGLSLFVVVLVISKKMINGYQKILKTEKDNFWWNVIWSDPEPTFGGYGGLIFIICGGAIGLITIGVNGSEVMKWSIVPEIALLKEIQYMLG